MMEHSISADQVAICEAFCKRKALTTASPSDPDQATVPRRGFRLGV